MTRHWTAVIAAAGLASGLVIALAGVAGRNDPIAATRVAEPAQAGTTGDQRQTSATHRGSASSPQRGRARAYVPAADRPLPAYGFGCWALNTVRCVPRADRSTPTGSTT
jgi:hypothetical protein